MQVHLISGREYNGAGDLAVIIGMSWASLFFSNLYSTSSNVYSKCLQVFTSKCIRNICKWKALFVGGILDISIYLSSVLLEICIMSVYISAARTRFQVDHLMT